MQDFTYYTPTKVIFGEDVENQCGSLIKEFQGTNVLIHFGSDRIKKSGLMGRITKSLDENNIKYTELGGVKSNPRIALVKEGIKIAKRQGIDFILAVGGGSVIDSAKAIALGAKFDGDINDFYSGKKTPDPHAPSINKGVVLTNAAAGSEMGQGSVITNEEGMKRSLGGQFNLLKFALENPKLTTTLPAYQSASGAFDAAMHSIERYFTPGQLASFTKAVDVAVIKDIFKEIKLILKDPNDLDARGNLMWGSTVSHNTITNVGNSTRGDWACHNLEHELGGMFDCAHGAGIAAIFTSWARYVSPKHTEHFANFGYDVLDIKPTGDVKKDSLKMIEKMEEMIRDITMPTSIVELIGRALTDDEIEILADRATDGGKSTQGNFSVLNKQDVINIYRGANH
jgi:alcohol dehydrogenase YqhD (iron-dependent ADH family)